MFFLSFPIATWLAIIQITSLSQKDFHPDPCSPVSCHTSFRCLWDPSSIPHSLKPYSLSICPCLQSWSPLLFMKNSFLWAAALNLYLASWSDFERATSMRSLHFLTLICHASETLFNDHAWTLCQIQRSSQYHFFLNMLKYLMLLAVSVFHSAVLIEYPILYKVVNYKS